MSPKKLLIVLRTRDHICQQNPVQQTLKRYKKLYNTQKVKCIEILDMD
jgi:hypothetical protein